MTDMEKVEKVDYNSIYYSLFSKLAKQIYEDEKSEKFLDDFARQIKSIIDEDDDNKQIKKAEELFKIKPKPEPEPEPEALFKIKPEPSDN